MIRYCGYGRSGSCSIRCELGLVAPGKRKKVNEASVIIHDPSA